jgi:hypothetical protein
MDDKKKIEQLKKIPTRKLLGAIKQAIRRDVQASASARKLKPK